MFNRTKQFHQTGPITCLTLPGCFNVSGRMCSSACHRAGRFRWGAHRNSNFKRLDGLDSQSTPHLTSCLDRFQLIGHRFSFALTAILVVRGRFWAENVMQQRDSDVCEGFYTSRFSSKTILQFSHQDHKSSCSSERFPCFSALISFAHTYFAWHLCVVCFPAQARWQSRKKTCRNITARTPGFSYNLSALTLKCK